MSILQGFGKYIGVLMSIPKSGTFMSTLIYIYIYTRKSWKATISEANGACSDEFATESPYPWYSTLFDHFLFVMLGQRASWRRDQKSA